MDDLDEAIHEVADLAINPQGYADDSAESDARAERRDALERELHEVVDRHKTTD